MAEHVEIALVGVGRIGRVHAENIARHPRARLAWTIDPDLAAASLTAARHGGRSGAEVGDALADPSVDAVLIASPTATHVALIRAAAAAGKAILCEKPVDLDLAVARRATAELAGFDRPLMIGFQRRFDPTHRAVFDAIRAGEIGAVEILRIISRDPAPPPAGYIEASGGQFRDMTIHDLDLARWLMGEEPVEVMAMAGCLVDPAIGAAGDTDTAQVLMRTARGAMVAIDNIRRAAYGYDQRVEALGSSGMVASDNLRPTAIVRQTAEHTDARAPLHFSFIERYADAYRLELDAFVRAVLDAAPVEVGLDDGVRALALADAAAEAARSGRTIRIG